MHLTPPCRHPKAGRLLLAVMACALLAASSHRGFAQDADNENADDPVQASLALRTALHHDPTLAAPLERLLKVFQKAGKVEDLLALYRNHLAQYPQDHRATTVLVRLLAATGSAEAEGAARKAVQRFPQNAYVHYQLARLLKTRDEAESLKHLDRAVELETLASRKLAWLDELLPAAAAQGERKMAAEHLAAVAKLAKDAAARLAVARRMIKHRFYDEALALLEQPAAGAAPEVMVDIELAAAEAEAGLKQKTKAAERLALLLTKVTADYWRRPEIVRRRLALIDNSAARDEVIRKARQRVKDNPRSEAAVLDLAQALVGFQRRREALKVLLAGQERITASQAIERRILELYDRLRDERGRLEYLDARIKSLPERTDLRVARVKSRFALARNEEALAEFEKIVANLVPRDKLAQSLQMGRYLRRRSLLSAAARLFERVVELDSAMPASSSRAGCPPAPA